MKIIQITILDGDTNTIHKIEKTFNDDLLWVGVKVLRKLLYDMGNEIVDAVKKKEIDQEEKQI